ncbi:MAG: hypothetical protein QOH62_2968 [Solirubrobacteraceae bacterium]|jgi:hypothetical protein|nr:hypothetical protein [Solirubrobacteraceae bacterium]
MPPRPTGLSTADAQDDFLRARRRRALAKLMARMARVPGDMDLILPFDEVVAALGRVAERDLGIQVIPVDSIVGTVDRQTGFDRSFRPTSSRVRTRWERIAAAMRRGEPLPPIEVYRIGDAHFVRDGHHRVSVARALGIDQIEAHVIEVITRVGASRELTIADLPRKSHERDFRDRVPLPPQDAARIKLSDPRAYGRLADAVEAWAYRASLERGDLLDREQAAREWFDGDYVPLVEALRDAGQIGSGTETDAYLRVGAERYDKRVLEG